jgi:hypothetical protein
VVHFCAVAAAGMAVGIHALTHSALAVDTRILVDVRGLEVESGDIYGTNYQLCGVCFLFSTLTWFLRHYENCSVGQFILSCHCLLLGDEQSLVGDE